MPAVGIPAVLYYAKREGYEIAGLIVIGRRSRHTIGADDAVQPVLRARERLYVTLDLRVVAEEDVGWCKRGAEISAKKVDVPVVNIRLWLGCVTVTLVEGFGKAAVRQLGGGEG